MQPNTGSRRKYGRVVVYGTYLKTDGSEHYMNIEREVPGGGQDIYLIRWPRCHDHYAAERLATRKVSTLYIWQTRQAAKEKRSG